MSRLDERQIAERLAALTGWQRLGDAIRRTWRFADFKQAMAFVNRVAEAAEAADHHPDILIEYSRVTLTLSTHDAGGLTTRDFDLAARLEA
jgi:4a-hydroxytetrahydrobiopterin dehydratase